MRARGLAGRAVLELKLGVQGKATSTLRCEPQGLMYGSAPGAVQLTGKAEELCIAADASDNGKFFAIVMGLCVDVERLHKRLCSSFGIKEIHMREFLPGQRKEEVVRLMDRLGTSAVRMYCLEIDKQGQFNALYAARKEPRQHTRSLYDAVDRCIMEEIKKAIDPSLEFYGLGKNWSDLSVEVDDDTERPVKLIGAKPGPPGLAHQLADAVAWSNHANVSLDNIRHENLVDEVQRRLRRRLKV